MQAVEHAASISVEDYLAGELKSEIRHEYIGGLVYAMAGTSREHNIICQNLLIALRSHLRGRPCQVFMESVKLRLRTANEDVFYYPDLIVTCDPRDTERYFTDFRRLSSRFCRLTPSGLTAAKNFPATRVLSPWRNTSWSRRIRRK